jgi:hypothetical protein
LHVISALLRDLRHKSKDRALQPEPRQAIRQQKPSFLPLGVHENDSAKDDEQFAYFNWSQSQ